MQYHSYHMPAEWEPQQAIWLAWPHQKEDWPGKFEPIPWVYADIIRHITATQKVRLIVADKKMQEESLSILERAHVNTANVEFFHIPTNRVWVRDSGPIFVKDVSGTEVLLDWKFNAWAKYDNWQLDNELPKLIAAQTTAECAEAIIQDKPIVLEGGAIDVNGHGLLLTTEECLLDQKTQARNPGLNKEDYTETFKHYLGVSEVIWLEKGIVGDDTHGHVDDVTRFVAPHKVVTAIETNKQDENYNILQENKQRLLAFRDEHGRCLEVIDLPMPSPLYFEDTRLPASYANFLICNEVVLVPTFNDANDRIALNILADCFPERRVVGVHAVDLVWGFGTLHCLSQQQPL